MCTASLCFLSFFCSSPSFFLSFFFYISSFFLCPFSFFFPFLLSLLFSRSSCFLFSFFSLLVYRTRAHAYARVLGCDTHGGVVKKAYGGIVKNAFRCAIVETLFFARSLCGCQSRRPVRRCWLFVWFPVLCVFPLCFCVCNASTVAPFPWFVFLAQVLPLALLFFAFFCPLTPFFRLARLFYRLLHFSPHYRFIF